MEVLLLISLAYIVSFIFGYFVEKLRVPWVFSALFVGLFLSFLGIKSSILDVLGYIGMMLMLFSVGMELNTREILKSGRLIAFSTLTIILAEAIVGSLLIHYFFGYDLFISSVVALSFATVGEAVLLPILEEFRLVTSRLGEFIIGVGILDDVFELFIVVLVSFILGTSAGHAGHTLVFHMTGLLILLALTTILRMASKLHKRMPYPRLGASLPLALSVFFLFLGIGKIVDMDALAAILAGISIRLFLEPSILRETIEHVNVITYGFFAPLFFLWVGATIDIGVLVDYLPLALLITILTALTKVFATLTVARKHLGTKQSILAGLGLCVRFSTSIVILKILFDAGIIDQSLYSTLVASTALFTLLIPFVFAWLLSKHAH